jgi:peptidoglycan/LPS O-acetylase OafA/YrhL
VPEIEFLRAFSVLSVLTYHLNPEFLPGGFVGVDVFFVISGYVISKSLLSREYGGFLNYLTEFYSRRFLRIVPALLVFLGSAALFRVLFIPSAWLSSTIDETGKWAVLGLSNFVLAFNGDTYFNPTSDYNPFLHTWSLAVEEQFYLVFPILFFVWLLATRRHPGGAAKPSLILATLAGASALTPYLLYPGEFSWHFYLLPSRFWELAVGALLFQCHAVGWLHPKSTNSAALQLALGAAFLAFAVSASSPNLFPFPGALAPTLGALFFINAVAKSRLTNGSAAVLLQNPVAIYFGRISYSLYLWHWGVFVLLRWTLGLETAWQMLLALLISVLFAAGSYHFIETPFRCMPAVRRQSPTVKITGSLVTIAFSFYLVSSLFSTQSSLTLSKTGDAYVWYPYGPSSNEDSGEEGRLFAGRHLFIVGNSHAQSYSNLISEAAEKLGFSYRIIYVGNCAIGNMMYPVLGLAGCAERVKDVQNLLKRDAKPGDVVFLASLRSPIFVTRQSIHLDVETVVGNHLEPTEQIKRQEASVETVAFISPLTARSVNILIDTPKPVFRTVPFRCSDWFNRHNPVCGDGLDFSEQHWNF